MQVVRHPGAALPSAISIGNFDGVHLGHAVILERLAAEAQLRGLASAVLTFEPLPREYFDPEHAPARLTALGERLMAISAHGIDTVFLQRFDARFAHLSPDEFAARLYGTYGARWVLVGHDFRYGAKRAGDFVQLAAAGKRLGFEVERLPAVCERGIRISSTAVREALARADFSAARELLGRPFTICGRVVHGARRGRGLGFPTANIRLARAKPPLTGIFAVKCHGAATRGLEGVASLGTNPAVVPGGPATLEAFLFDFDGDLYGRRLTIEFVKKLREEAYFASLEALAAQIQRDCDAAREVFRGV